MNFLNRRIMTTITSYLFELLIRRSAIMRLSCCARPLLFFSSRDYNYHWRRRPLLNAPIRICVLVVHFFPTLESRHEQRRDSRRLYPTIRVVVVFETRFANYFARPATTLAGRNIAAQRCTQLN